MDGSVEVILARLEGKIDTNFAVIHADIKSQGESVDDHEQRIRSLERNTPTRDELVTLQNMLRELNRWRWKLIGFFSAISAVIGIVVGIVMDVLQNTSFH